MTALAFTAAVLLAFVGLLWLGQDRLIFFPQPVVAGAPLPPSTQPLDVTTTDGTRLQGWIVPGQLTPAPVIIYFGGNAEEVSWTVADSRWPAGWALATVNYRGYGTSAGKPSERALAGDALAVFDAIAARPDIDPRRIVVFGRSLGSALAVHLAATRPVAAAILVSPFDSLTAVGRVHYPWLPVSLLLRHRFETLDAARAAGAPVLTIVAAADEIIPTARSRALHDAWTGPKDWLPIPGADHNTVGAYDAYWEGIANFLASR